MSEKEQFDQFEAWWKTLNVYDPTLKALCGSAWMQATKTDESKVQNEVSAQAAEIRLFEQWWKKHAGVLAGPPEFRRFCKRKSRNAWLARATYDTQIHTDDTDPWVTQDRVPARVGIDEYRYASFEEDDWKPVTGDWDDFAVHGWVDHEGDTLLLRCRASQLPERSEDPDEWVVQDRVPIRVEIDRCWYMDGHSGLPADPEDMWQKYKKDYFLDGKGHGDYVRDGGGTLHVMCRRRDLPTVEPRNREEALAQLVEEGQKLGMYDQQPAKTRVRLWMRCDGGQFGSAVVASTFEKSGDWQEIHHDAEGFYVKQQ